MVPAHGMSFLYSEESILVDHFCVVKPKAIVGRGSRRSPTKARTDDDSTWRPKTTNSESLVERSPSSAIAVVGFKVLPKLPDAPNRLGAND